MNFANWILNNKLVYLDNVNLDLNNEAFESDAIDNYQALDAKWVPDLSAETSQYIYKFNVPGDNHCSSGYCYLLYVSLDEEKGATISFSRDGSYGETSKNVAGAVFMSVLKGLSEYIKAKSPPKLSWSAAVKSGGKKNQNAREHIYEKWSLRNLYPDKYIPIGSQSWIRRDIYQDKYVPLGYPDIDSLDANAHVSQKRKSFDEHLKKVNDAQGTIRRNRIEEQNRQRQERERRRKEVAQNILLDPKLNKEGIKIGDIVHYEHYSPYCGKVASWQFGYYDNDERPNHWTADNLFFKINVPRFDYETGELDWNSIVDSRTISMSEVKKETPEQKTERETKLKAAHEEHKAEAERIRKQKEERLKSFVNGPQNPNGVKVDDVVIVRIPYTDYNGKKAKIKEFSVGRWSDYLHARVEWIDTPSESEYWDTVFDVKNLFKYYPGIEQNWEREQELARQRTRLSNRVQRAAEIEASNQLALNHPENPQGLKVGDHVKVIDSGPHAGPWSLRGRSGVIDGFANDYSHLVARIKFGTSTVTHEVYPHSLEKDATQEARSQATQARQGRRQQFAQNVQSGGLNLGDHVKVTAGLHRNKMGRITRFQPGTGGAVRVIVTASDGSSFSTTLRYLQRQDPPVNTPTPENPPVNPTAA